MNGRRRGWTKTRRVRECPKRNLMGELFSEQFLGVDSQTDEDPLC